MRRNEEGRKEWGRGEGGGVNGGREEGEKGGRKPSETRKKKKLLHATKPNSKWDLHGHSNMSTNM